MSLRFLSPAFVLIALFNFHAAAQSPERRAAAQETTQSLPSNAGSLDVIANEISLLRKTVQSLNVRLREIGERFGATGAEAAVKQHPITLGLDILTRAEQRAEGMRKLLLEVVEKESALKGRIAQIEEEMRPESIERALSLAGSTRPAELREMRRKVLDAERKGVENLLGQASQSRLRLEEDVRDADLLVTRLRQKVLPLIEREIEKYGNN